MFKLIDEHVEEAIVVVLLSLMSLVVGLQVFMRYVMGDALSWTGEFSRYCFIWATYIGVSYGVKRNSHICITALSDRLPARMRRYVSILALLIFGAFALLVIKESFVLAMKVLDFGQKSPAMGIPMGWIYLAPTVGFLLVIWRLAQNMMRELRSSPMGGA